jgi:KRAB domain-containing zinc finger protein
MKQHVEAVHLKLKRFFCDQCDYAAYLSTSFAAHMSVKHSLVNPFECGECSRKFANGSNLKRHFEVFHGKGKEEKSFKCSLCAYVTSWVFHLRDHLRVKHGQVI